METNGTDDCKGFWCEPSKLEWIQQVFKSHEIPQNTCGWTRPDPVAVSVFLSFHSVITRNEAHSSAAKKSGSLKLIFRHSMGLTHLPTLAVPWSGETALPQKSDSSPASAVHSFRPRESPRKVQKTAAGHAAPFASGARIPDHVLSGTERRPTKIGHFMTLPPNPTKPTDCRVLQPQDSQRAREVPHVSKYTLPN